MNTNTNEKDETIKTTQPNVNKKLTLKVATTGILIAVGLVLSYLNPFAYFKIFGTKINPFAHIINAISGVLIGLGFAVVTAAGIATLRFTLGIGSIHAFHGGISGAIVVGLVALILIKNKDKYTDYAALFEPLGTIFIGGTIAYVIDALGTGLQGLLFYWGLFAASCIPGSIIGFIILKIIRKAGISWEDYYELL
ncbi:MAG: energy coupling factor transporter S component ThiW [Candidatus Lokiarchaeota archaeon]|nr:energy coupling factor transporter S component ThiW [Candidatus Lokiarchaeota archaeon]MBD3201632.1 energy coupling factor transporter S component ThiW [Candidatus Lokiarchaeota archaeon]